MEYRLLWRTIAITLFCIVSWVLTFTLFYLWKPQTIEAAGQKIIVTGVLSVTSFLSTLLLWGWLIEVRKRKPPRR